MTEQQKRDVNQIIEVLQKRWGQRAIGLGSTHLATVPVLPTGFPRLDRFLDGGLPRGRITEIVGRPTSGGTTLALRVMAAAQQEGDMAVYFDLASVFDADYAVKRGIRVSDLLLVRATVDASLEMLFDVVASGIPGVVVFNTFPSLTRMQQKQLASVLVRLAGLLSRSRCALLLLTQPYPDQYLPYSPAVRLQAQSDVGSYQPGQGIEGYQVLLTILKHKPGSEGQGVRIHIPLDEAEREREA